MNLNHLHGVFAYRSVIGSCLTVMATMGGDLPAARCLVMLVLVSAVSAESFDASRITGSENLVLLEHVWVTRVSTAATLSVLQIPIPEFAMGEKS